MDLAYSVSRKLESLFHFLEMLEIIIKRIIDSV